MKSWMSPMNAILFALIVLLLVGQCAQAQTTPPTWGMPAGPETSEKYKDVATYMVATGQDFQVCWSDGGNGQDISVDIDGNRIEGGGYKRWVSELQRADWEESVPGDPDTRYCYRALSVTKVGHYSLRIRICNVPRVSEETSCSEWVESITPYVAPTQDDPGTPGGVVDDMGRGWWYYVYLPAPVVEID